MEIISLDPLTIQVREGLDRYRQELGDVEALADSFKRLRQILPIVINRNHELIDGGRRLAAAIIAGIQVKCVYEDIVDPFEMRELELEANLYRKDYTPAEKAKAISDLHILKQSKYGKSTSGSSEGWTIEQTAKLLGQTRGSVYNAMEISSLIDTFPQLKNAKKSSEILRAGKNLQRLSVAMEGLKKHEEIVNRKENPFQLFNEDAIQHMISVPDKSIDILLTDPIYGINADKIAMTMGGKTGGDFTTCGYKISDSPDEALFYYFVLAKESYRFTTDSAHGYVFVGPEHFWSLREMFMDAGWRVHVKPLIWIKRETGQCNVPSAWPASCYEMLMYIRKDTSRLIKEGQPDWIECPPVLPSQRLHPYEKPIPLLMNLLERVALPGQKLYDPFMGSGSAIEAGIKLRLYSIGTDISPEAYSMACSRINKIIEENLKKEGESS